MGLHMGILNSTTSHSAKYRQSRNSRRLFNTSILCLAASSFAGCAHTTSPKSSLPEPSITYNLPDTVAELKLDLLLKSCTGGLSAKPKVTVTQTATASPHQDHQFTLSGRNLKSFTKKRDVKVLLHEHGSLKSINVTVNDKTPAIIGNILKIAATVVGFDATAPAKATNGCNDVTNTALDNAKLLQKAITDERKLINESKVSDYEKASQKITVLATELARIQSEYLTITLKRRFTFNRSNNLIGIQWKNSEFAKWTDSKDKKASKKFSLGVCVYPPGDDRLKSCTASLLENAKAPGPAEISSVVETPKCQATGCMQTIVFRSPKPGVIKTIALNDDFVDVSKDQTLDQSALSIAQWGELSYLPLSVGFGGSKTIAMELDAYGKPTSYGWISDARAAEITGSASTVLDNASTTLGTIKGQELKKQQSQITALETQQKLNKLEECRAIIESGGHMCPE